MCGLVDDAFSFVKDSVGEIASHPWQALGAAAGVPGYDPFFGGLLNNGPGGAIISPTGNFTSGAWNDMYQANPGDSGALGTFGTINSIADKVAPAAAGYFAAPGLGAALGGSSGGTTGIGADTFSTGLGEAGAGGASSLGGLESGMGGAAMFGPTAGTGTAIGSELAANAGAGGLGIAGAGGLGSEFAGTGGTYAAGLGGGSSGTGLGSATGTGAVVPGNPSGLATPVDMGGAGQSLEGGQAAMAPGGNPAAAGAIQTGGAPAEGGNLSTMFGPASTSAYSPTGTAIGQSTAGVGGGVTPYGATLGQDLSQGAAQGGIGDYLKSPTGIGDLFKLGQQGLGAWQKIQQGNAAKNYANSVSSLFGPNSPYAQQMQQTLARTDAASGRNSQYGTRATQLAAALAGKQAEVMGGNNYAQAAQNTAGNSALNGLFGLAQTGAGQRLGSAAFNGLSSLFGG
jgi:hypothetical protein